MIQHFNFTALGTNGTIHMNLVRDKNNADETIKENLFDKLEELKIISVYILFNGNSGSTHFIDYEVNYLDKENGIHQKPLTVDVLPDEKIYLEHEKDGPYKFSLRMLMEEMITDILYKNHPQWNNDEGGYGNVKLITSKKQIAIEINIRVVTTETYSYSI